jgi:uncharacterized membrane-anchored protein
VNRSLPRLWIAASLALVVAVVGALIAKKERIRREGTVVLLRLAPVDPRSLMQGDYMALRFELAREIERTFLTGEREQGEDDEEGVDGEDGGRHGSLERQLGEGAFAFAPVKVDERGVGTLAVGDPAALRFRYRRRQGHAWLGTNAFFFQEGQAARYARARYGEFRLDRESGEAVLVGLRDEERRPL